MSPLHTWARRVFAQAGLNFANHKPVPEKVPPLQQGAFRMRQSVSLYRLLCLKALNLGRSDDLPI
jgi:hypothetical protein